MQHYIGFKLLINNMQAFSSKIYHNANKLLLGEIETIPAIVLKNKEAYLWSGEVLPIQVPLPFSTSMH